MLSRELCSTQDSNPCYLKYEREREKQREKSFVERREREKQRNAKKQSERNNHIYRVSLLSFSFVVLRSGIMGFITSA